MNVFDIQPTLETLTIIVDNREQPTEKSRKRYESFNAPYRRGTLKYGDYSAELTLPNGETFSLTDKVVIERKMSIDELNQCFFQGRNRFKREFDKARSAGAKTYLLIEESARPFASIWQKIERHGYRSRANERAVRANLLVWMARYSTPIIFCHADESGRLIADILKREAAEILERMCDE